VIVVPDVTPVKVYVAIPPLALYPPLVILPPPPPPPITVTVIVEPVAPSGTVNTVFKGVVYCVDANAVALHPSPDLSLHVEIAAPLAAGTPVAFGSEASSHKVHPGKSFGENQDPTLPIAHPFEGPV
jgi:hypothetical protein